MKWDDWVEQPDLKDGLDWESIPDDPLTPEDERRADAFLASMLRVDPDRVLTFLNEVDEADDSQDTGGMRANEDDAGAEDNEGARLIARSGAPALSGTVGDPVTAIDTDDDTGGSDDARRRGLWSFAPLSIAAGLLIVFTIGVGLLQGGDDPAPVDLATTVGDPGAASAVADPDETQTATDPDVTPTTTGPAVSQTATDPDVSPVPTMNAFAVPVPTEPTPTRAPEREALPPLAIDDSYVVEPGASIEMNVLLNDRDPAGGDLRIAFFRQPEIGEASPDPADQVLTYTAPSDIDDSEVVLFSYTVSNEAGLTTMAQVTVLIQPQQTADSEPSPTPTVDNLTGPVSVEYLVRSQPSDGAATPIVNLIGFGDETIEIVRVRNNDTVVNASEGTTGSTFSHTCDMAPRPASGDTVVFRATGSLSGRSIEFEAVCLSPDAEPTPNVVCPSAPVSVELPDSTQASGIFVVDEAWVSQPGFDDWLNSATFAPGLRESVETYVGELDTYRALGC